MNNLNDTDLKVLIALGYFCTRGLDFNVSQISTYANLSRPTVYKSLEKIEQYFTLDKTRTLFDNHKKLNKAKYYEKVSILLKKSS